MSTLQGWQGCGAALRGRGRARRPAGAAGSAGWGPCPSLKATQAFQTRRPGSCKSGSIGLHLTADTQQRGQGGAAPSPPPFPLSIITTRSHIHCTAPRSRPAASQATQCRNMPGPLAGVVGAVKSALKGGDKTETAAAEARGTGFGGRAQTISNLLPVPRAPSRGRATTRAARGRNAALQKPQCTPATPAVL